MSASGIAYSGIQGGLNAAMMAAFSVPEGKLVMGLFKGSSVGVGLAVGMGAFDVLFPLLFPEDPAPPALTTGDLDDALDKLKNELLDAIWLSKADDAVDRVSARYDELVRHLNKIKGFTISKDTYSFVHDPSTDADRQDLNNYFSDTLGPLNELQRIRKAISLDSFNDANVTNGQVLQHRTTTLGLYGMIASTTVVYLKSAVAWDWGNELLGAQSYAQYKKDSDWWNNASQQDRDDNPKRNPDTIYGPYKPGISTAAPSWEDWAKRSGGWVENLTKEIEEILEYCEGTPAAGSTPAKPGMFTGICDAYEKLDNTIATQLPVANGVDAMMMKMEGSTFAPMRIQAWETALAGDGLRGLTEPDLDGFAHMIRLWKAARASVKWREYETVAGDTLAKIAASVYKDATLAQRIADTNQGVLKSPVNVNGVLDTGTVLHIYDKEVLPDLAAAGEDLAASLKGKH